MHSAELVLNEEYVKKERNVPFCNRGVGRGGVTGTLPPPGSLRGG